MKQAPNARKQRGRAPQRKGGKGNSGGGNRTENKARGNPKQLLEKYKTQARDALQGGDRVTAEYYFQFADHYQRVLNEMQANREQANEEREDKQARRGRGRRDRHAKPNEAETSAAGEEEAETQAPAEASESGGETAAVDPANAEQPVEVHPELDLDGTVAEEKPKRRAPTRRRRPAKPKAEAEAAPADGAAAPEGDEAA